MICIRTKPGTNERPATKMIILILEVLPLIAFMVQVTEQLVSDCGTYRAENGKICHMCNPGSYKIGDCMEDGMSARCLPCPNGTYQTTCNQALSCASCSLHCQTYYSLKISECNKTMDIKCQCDTGFYFKGDVNGKCIKHKSCPAGQGVKMQGTPISDTVCEPCIPGKTFSNVSSSIQHCRNCTVCMTIVISECTPVSDTVCAIAAVDVAHETGSPAIAIAVSVTFAGLCLIGLLIFYLWRQKIISCNNYCAFGQSPDIQMGVEPVGKTDVDDVHINLDAEHLGQDNHSSSDTTDRRILENLARNVEDFDTFFRELYEATASNSDGDSQDVDVLIDQMHNNYPKNVVKANYKLLKKWSDRYGRADEKFYMIISNALRQIGANKILANLQVKFRPYFPINGGNDNPVGGEIQRTFPT